MERLSWADARPLLEDLFRPWPHTWPTALTPLELARLLTMDHLAERTGLLGDAIDAACHAGDLPAGWGTAAIPVAGYPQVWTHWTTHFVEARDFAAWLKRQHREPGPHLAAWFRVSGVDQAEPVPAPRPVQRTAAQDAELLHALRAAGYDPANLPTPPAGKPCPAKAAARRACTTMSAAVFNKAWQRMRSAA
jgi:hypothetical protein